VACSRRSRVRTRPRPLWRSGNKPVDLLVMLSTKVKQIINLKTAKALA
jgi:hypothetical protein